VNIAQLKPQPAAPAAQPASIVAWVKENKTALAVVTAAIVVLVIWAKLEGGEEGGEEK